MLTAVEIARHLDRRFELLCMSAPEIQAAYPDLEAEDVREALRYVAEAVRERELPLALSG